MLQVHFLEDPSISVGSDDTAGMGTSSILEVVVALIAQIHQYVSMHCT